MIVANEVEGWGEDESQSSKTLVKYGSSFGDERSRLSDIPKQKKNIGLAAWKTCEQCHRIDGFGPSGLIDLIGQT